MVNMVKIDLVVEEEMSFKEIVDDGQPTMNTE